MASDYPDELDPDRVGSFDSRTGKIAADWRHRKRLVESYPHLFPDGGAE